ncbi:MULTISPECIES: TRL-like family protein [Marinobacter]|uniref:TRL-like family protein n=1 Tax=Marinobacter TaxID=2742 RepID=UPI001D066FA8|nr:MULTISPECIES: TRL-like family protein [Marinobacter]MCK7569047.1 TRL-like family protein [Marinobacter xestospongiae]UDL05770.1 TRL-like family protein [Marinobacter sp. CA1]
MKKFFAAAAIAATVTLSGCATSFPVGGLYTDVELPAGATSNTAASKTGVAKCQSILSLVAIGDCSIEAAKEDGNISSVSHMDWKAKNILGIIGTYELRVHGE